MFEEERFKVIETSNLYIDIKKGLGTLLVCKKTSNQVKLYLFPKIQKHLSDLSRRPIILNFETPTEKLSEFLDFHVNPIIRNGNF